MFFLGSGSQPVGDFSYSKIGLAGRPLGLLDPMKTITAEVHSQWAMDGFVNFC